MFVNKKKSAATVVASFGAAMSTVYLAPSAEADIVDLTGNLPGALPYSSSATISFSFVPGTGVGADFFQYNDSIGKSFYNPALGDIAGFITAPLSNLISTGMAFTSFLSFSTTASGTATFAFLTNANQVGWLRLDFGGPGGDILYLAAAYNDTPGQRIHAGLFAVPEPGSALAGLAGLALGATGVRRMRKKKVA